VSNAWSDGYITEVEYTSSFYKELTPALQSLVATIQLVESPAIDGPYTYLELGCGHGTTSCVLAAANPQGRFYANDFNPTHILNAQRLATEAGIDNLTFLEKSFAELLDAELPEFDFIGLHGIASWINAENLTTIVELIRRRLRPGGMVYVSYNTLPGWATTAPMQHLFEAFSSQLTGTVFQRLERCVALADRLSVGKAKYFAANPALDLWLKTLKTQDRHYLAHEYLCGNWTAFYSADLHARMGEAKLTFVGSASVIENYDDASVAPDLRQLLRETADRGLRETLTDFVLNRQFRRDIFSRGTIRIDTARQRQVLLQTRFALVRARAACGLETQMPGGTVRLDDPVFPAMLDLLAERPRALAELVGHPATSRSGADTIVRAMMSIVSLGYAQVCLPAAGDAERRKRTDRLNDVVLRRATQSGSPRFMASPVLGSGLYVDPVDSMIAVALRSGRDPVDLTLERLRALNQSPVKDGQPITDPAAIRAEIENRVRSFHDGGLAMLQALGILTDLRPQPAVAAAVNG